MLEVRFVKCGEFENERPDFLAMRLQRIQELTLEQFGIQEIGIRSAGPRSKSRKVREFLDRDFIGDLEPESKMIQHLRTQSADPFVTQKMVVAGIHTDSRKCLRVFPEAFALEFCLGEFASRQIPLIVVKLSAPAGVFS